MAGSLSGIFDSTKKIIVVAGHYGTGKTNVAVNLALAYAAMGERTVIADIDIVNPYFRTADAAAHLTAAGVECIIPEYAISNVDLPTLPPQLYSRCADAARGEDVRIILDVGGDDDGAAALGGLRGAIGEAGYDMLFVANAYRPLTAEPEDALACMRDIEARCGLRATYVVNNSNLGRETDEATVLDSLPYAKKLCELADLPLAFTSVMSHIGEKIGDRLAPPVFFIENATKNIYG